MLPRIAETSNIPHISLSVALINLDHPSLHLSTNQFHPETHPTECLNSQTLLDNGTATDIASNYIHICPIEETPGAITSAVEDLEVALHTYVEQLKQGLYNTTTQDMTVNQKAKFIEENLNNILYKTVMRYAI